MAIMREKIFLLLEKEDFEIMAELSEENVLRRLLSCQHLDLELQLDVLKLVAKASSCHADRQKHHEFIKTLVSLKVPFITFISLFLSAIQTRKLVCKAIFPLKLIFDVVLSIFQCVPVSSTNFVDVILPQLQMILKKLPEEGNKELSSDIAELLQQREDVVSQENSICDKRKKEGKDPPPPCDFRSIDLLPNKEEIESEVKPYLRANVVKGTYENVDHYLDVQFRLMREDMFRYLRESIAEYKSTKWPRVSSAFLKNGHIYFNAQILSKQYINGILFVAEVRIGRKVNWNSTKRLTSNSLLCISSDGFQTFAFVHVRSARQLPEDDLSCLLEFSAADGSDEGNFQLGKLYDIIETTSFYESYRYVLKRLQLFTDENFPLSSPLLFLEDFDNKPEYWKKFSFLSEVEFEKNAFQEMMSSENSQFDEHQHQAFQMALSDKVSVIQGPPGTGKTYLGLQIVKWLVQNASLHMGTPILVICYTNHALDQFLEGVLEFTEKVVRIGGQCKNLALKYYHVNNIVKALLRTSSEVSHLNEDEKKSRSIGRKLLGSKVVLENSNKYTVTLTEKLLREKAVLIEELESNPFYSTTMMLKILPKNVRTEILGWLDSCEKVKGFEKFLLWCMEHWLCISETYLHVYEDLPEMLSGIIQELLSYMRDNDYFNTNVTHNELITNTNELPANPENKFTLDLWKLFLKTGNMAPIDNINISPKDADNCVKYFLGTHTLDKRTVFKFLEKAVSKCLDQTNNDSELAQDQVWSNGLLDRWSLFLKWKSDVRIQLVRELNLLQNEYFVSLEEREAIKFRNNVKIAKHADILGLTTTGAAKHWKLLEEIGPRVVVGEEAAEVLEAHITTALTKAAAHLILIGDHRQLRPIPSVYELGRRFKLDVSMFERLMANGAPSQCLETQHRMRPCIAELLVPEIYNKLENHPSVREYADIKGMANNMYFIKHNVYEDDNNDLRSHRNKHEADFLVRLCGYLLQQGYSEGNITILTTYVGQLKLLIEAMNKKLKGRRVHATTVDNFQGEENDIILLSFVRSNETNSLGFIEVSNRICVALSRAKKGLFCIGNFNSFSQKCNTWRKIIQKLKKMRLISSSLPLKCQNHPTNITLVSCASDFDKVPHGGCTEKCMYRLACGHVCPLRCHIATKEHDEMFCSKKCREDEKRKNSNTLALFENYLDESLVDKILQVSKVSPDPIEHYYESDDYERDISAYVETGSNLRGSRAVSPHKENCGEDSLFHSQDYGQDSMEFIRNRESEESPVLNQFIAISNENECADLERCTEQQYVTKASTVPVLVANEDDLFLSGPMNKTTGNETLLKTADDLDEVNCENDSFATHSEISEPECNNGLSVCESAIQSYMSEMLSDTRFGGYSDNSKLKDEDLHLQEQIFRKDKFLEILRSGYEEKIFGSGEHDVSHYTADGEPEEISQTCDLHNSKKFQCDVLISKKLQCRHEASVPCNKYNSQYECNVVVDVQLPCLHVFSVTCRDWMWLKHVRCTVNVSLLMPCGKRIHFICSEGPYHADCVATVLKCGHRVPCYTNVNEYKCEVPIKCSLPCSHEISVPCIVYHYSKKLATLCEVQSETGREQNILQKLCYERCNFLMKCGHRCLGECGSCTYDRKHRPCYQMVKRNLPCGHQLECECNTKDILCLEKCNVLMKCGHRCCGKCGTCTTYRKHQKCSELVIRHFRCGHSIECKCHVTDPHCLEKCNFLLDCSHRCSGKCGTCTRTKKHPSCFELVKVVLPCGHQHETKCHVKNLVCNEKCEAVLSCGHPCPGQCGECFSLQIHAMCSELVNRQLPCGHCVVWLCGSPLPVCEKRCLFGCQHVRCINSCSHPCIMCSARCDWKCEHFTCSMRCGDLCNRPPCDVRCRKVLDCGHQCCGYCGEPCPDLCLLCDRASIPGTNCSNWYVLLENCQHSVLMEDLKAYFTKKSEKSCPLCPKCGTVITRNRRFGNCIKSWLSHNLHDYSQEYYANLSSETDYDMLNTFVSEMIEKNISLAFIPKTVNMCRNIYVLQCIASCCFVPNPNLKGKICSLEKWFWKHSVICTEQQVEESSRAVRRLCALWYMKNLIVREPEPNNSDTFCSDVLDLLESNPFGENEEKKMIEILEQNAPKSGEKNNADGFLSFVQHLASIRTAPDIRKYFADLKLKLRRSTVVQSLRRYKIV